MLAAGSPVSAVAAETPFSESAARRHIRLHLQPRLEAERMEPLATVHVSDFTDRLIGLADRAASVGAYASQTQNGKLALEAIHQEREILSILIGRLGIDTLEAADLLREARAVLRAIRRGVLTNGLTDLESLAWVMDDEGAPAVATALRTWVRQSDLTSSEGTTNDSR